MKLTKSGIISRNETDVLKGLGILCIVLHNFCHNISGAMTENEFGFSLERSTNYFTSLVHGEHLFLNFFFYWGHFGVALFVFLTAYGLTRKTMLAPDSMGTDFKGGANFVWQRAKKLWAIMVSAIFLYCLVNGVVYWLTGGWGQFYLRHVDTQPPDIRPMVVLGVGLRADSGLPAFCTWTKGMGGDNDHCAQPAAMPLCIVSGRP